MSCEQYIKDIISLLRKASTGYISEYLLLRSDNFFWICFLTLILALPSNGQQYEKKGNSNVLQVKSRTGSTEQPAFYNALYVKADGVDLISDSQFSDNNGRTWNQYLMKPDYFTSLPYGYRRDIITSVLDKLTGRIVTIINSLDTPGLDPGINEPPVAQKTYYLRYMVSDDAAKTWLFEEPIISEGNFSQNNPFEGIIIGKNSIYLGDLGCIPVVTKQGKILVPAQTTIIGSDGNLANPGGGYTYTDVLVLQGTWTSNKRLSWKASQRVEGDPKRSTRGMIEPTLLETDYGQILMIMRGSNGGKFDPENMLPSYKWYSVSKDGGETWSQPEPWKFDDGNIFYSPSSMSSILKHSSGRCFWVGNMSSANCQNNLPRFPLVIAEINTKSLNLIRSSLLTVDTQKEEDLSKGRLDISHMTLIEDRETKEIILTYPRNTNTYKSTEWITVRFSLQDPKK
jgi:hypothetical protein